jgi:hypothetical protein
LATEKKEERNRLALANLAPDSPKIAQLLFGIVVGAI